MGVREYTFVSGIETAALPSSAVPTVSSSPYELLNYAIACSVASNALTIALKDAAGANPSASSPVKIGFRSSTAANGDYSQRSVTAALSTVISSGSTGGHTSAKDTYIYIYAIDVAGTIELAWSGSLYDEGTLYSTTAEGGAGAADSILGLYSTTSRSNVPIRLIARLKSNQTTAGTWAAVPTEISLVPFLIPETISGRAYTSTTVCTNNTTVTVVFTTAAENTQHGAMSSAGVFTCPKAGRYLTLYRLSLGVVTPASIANGRSFSGQIWKNSAMVAAGANEQAHDLTARGFATIGSAIVRANKDDTLFLKAYQNMGGGDIALDGGETENFFHVIFLGDY
jgi:hypothetical protein